MDSRQIFFGCRFLAGALLACSVQAVVAQSEGEPVAPAGASTEAAVPTSAESASTAPVPGNAGIAAAASDTDVVPGPLEAARRMLFERIQQAKNEGIGISAYLGAFKAMEDDVRAGKGVDELRPRIESLARSLKDQLDRSKVLKTQRPAAASYQGGSGGGGGAAGASAPSLAGGRKPSADQIEAMAAKLGVRDPAMLEQIKERLQTGDIPAGLKDKLMNSEKGKRILESLGQ